MSRQRRASSAGADAATTSACDAHADPGDAGGALLRRLFAPLPLDEALPLHAELAVRHCSGRGSGALQGLWQDGDWLALLWHVEPALAERVFAHHAGETVALPADAAAAPWRWALDQHAAGRTVIVNAVSRHHLPIARVCTALARRLDAWVTANAYWAPPQARGYAAHFDTDDTLFVQLEGRKRWQLFRPRVTLPLASQAEGLDPAGLEPLREVELQPGDLLLVPRGVIHTPVAGPQGSLHVTFGIRHLLACDLLDEAVRELAGSDARWWARADLADERTLSDLLTQLHRALGDGVTPARLRWRLQRRRAQLLPPMLDPAAAA